MHSRDARVLRGDAGFACNLKRILRSPWLVALGAVLGSPTRLHALSVENNGRREKDAAAGFRDSGGSDQPNTRLHV